MINISIDTSEVADAVSQMGTANSWLPSMIDAGMVELGKPLSDIMRNQVSQHRYTGTLESSINFEYNSSRKELAIGPDAKRGQFDAGEILQRGAKSTNVPWRPIQAWAGARGIDSRGAFFILIKLRRNGVSAHPYLEETMNRRDFSDELEKAADRMGVEISSKAISGGKMVGGVKTT